MRIDYSGPKKSCSTPQLSQNRPRKESSGGVLIAAAVSGVVCLGIGFGSGWMLSQRSAKKGFMAAMEQQSLENSPQLNKIKPTPKQPIAHTPTEQAQAGTTGQQAGATGGIQTTTEQPLSFYKTLPSGQKNNAMGSGINPREDKTAKQPLQAAMPTNVNRAASQTDENIQKQPPQSAPSKPAGHNDASGLTVQVASYSLRSEAETMRNTLAAKGYNVVIVESHLGDRGTWYRVRIGKHLDSEAAKELAKKLGKGAIAIPERD